MPLPPRPPPPKKGPPGLDPRVFEARARGALLGLAVGDALGSTNEFRKLPAPLFPQLCDGPLTEMKGGGQFSLKPGQVTDDTQMACCIAQVLKADRKLEPEVLARAYVKWLDQAFDVGELTRTVLTMLKEGRHWENAARQTWLSGGKRQAGNGSLMRTAPIGVFFARDQKARIEASLRDSQLTHYDPRCQLACTIFNGSLAAAINWFDKPKGPPGKVAPPPPSGAASKAQLDAIVAGGLADISLAGAQLGHTAPDFVIDVKDAAAALRADIDAARKDDPLLYGPELHMHAHEGFVRVAFRLAYWELFHAPSFEAALIDVVNRGGDADTNGAICGALLGATYGEHAIPERWRTPVLEALGVPGRGPLWDLYHPRHLLPLVGN
jgi:ADP-ribosyl-[dinitrogen reductase] hydrolase